ncbi:1-phosphofructokinase [Helicobacter enhydrae]|uniref:1-phosphofructokinase n=1 Tax=Helicobacter enhydrae TaxID=222136 RepID=A0A1B1U3N8_9HELI|nr:1-phosphofructokinase [Helicobacter enhydrae]ANV97369.1 1-phosphofructokinase [Helicobacter enhydrae]
MIYTLTLNPSLDYILNLKALECGKTNRVEDSCLFAGGKGINVSLMLQNLGIESVVLGFLAGFSGQEICNRLEQKGLDCRFVMLEKGHTRINVKLHTQTEETEINASGFEVGDLDLGRLKQQLEQIENHSILVLAGSVPCGVEQGIYAEIMQELEAKNLLVILDAQGVALREALSWRPFLVKPNLSELQSYFQEEIQYDSLQQYALRLQEQGARNVIISLGGDGAVMLTENNEFFTLKAPQGRLVNSVGAGDSMVAGFVAGWLQTQDYAFAFRYAIACGSASAFAQGFGTLEDVQNILKKMEEVK